MVTSTKPVSEDTILISSAWARNSVVDTGSSGGGNALLIILAAFILLGFGYAIYKKWQRRTGSGESDPETNSR